VSLVPSFGISCTPIWCLLYPYLVSFVPPFRISWISKWYFLNLGMLNNVCFEKHNRFYFFGKLQWSNLYFVIIINTEYCIRMRRNARKKLIHTAAKRERSAEFIDLLSNYFDLRGHNKKVILTGQTKLDRQREDWTQTNTLTCRQSKRCIIACKTSLGCTSIPS